MKEVEICLSTKMSLEEGSDLWSNFSKFALFDDFKDLYKKCTSECSKVIECN